MKFELYYSLAYMTDWHSVTVFLKHVCLIFDLYAKHFKFEKMVAVWLFLQCCMNHTFSFELCNTNIVMLPWYSTTLFH